MEQELDFPDGFKLQAITIPAEAQTKRRSKLFECLISEQVKNGFDRSALAARPIAVSAKGPKSVGVSEVLNDVGFERSGWFEWNRGFGLYYLDVP